MTVPTRRPAAVLAALAALLALALAAAAPPASAGVLTSSVGPCEERTFERPFLPWLDVAEYVLAPDGTFEAGAAGWTLDGAQPAEGNETFYVHGAGETTSLAIAPGGQATSPATCVGIEHPTLRLFATRSGGTSLSALRVEVLFEDATGAVQSLVIGEVLGGSSWQPTAVMPIVANLLPLLPGDHTAVAFRFTAQGPSASWRIDDVYVDPYRKN